MADVWLKLSKLLILKMVSSHVLFIILTFFVLSAILMVNLLNSGPASNLDNENDIYASRHGLTRGIKAWKDPRRSVVTDKTPYWNIEDLDSIGTKAPKCKQNVLLLVLVTSAPGHFDRRLAIRNTWAKDKSDINGNSNTTWKTVFLIGKGQDFAVDRKLENEFYEHGDILLGDYVDTYRNLTLKVQHGLKWASDNCQPQYLLKTDDDCFVSTKFFTQFLSDHNQIKTGLYAGSMFNNREVIRSRFSKWYVSTEDFPLSVYPEYASGTGYILSGDVLRGIVNVASEEKAFPVEDAFTGVLMNKIGAKLLNTGRFTTLNYKWRVCNYLYFLVIHGITPEQQYLALKYTDDALQKCPGQSPSTTWN